jgi:predicted RNase H-like nuclease (RuvC/YqgF family)
MRSVKQSLLVASLMVFITCTLANAQTQKEITASTTRLLEATQQYKTSSGDLVRLQEDEVNKAAAKLQELRVLVAEGLVARSELQTTEQSIANLRAQLDGTKKQVADSDQRIAKIRAGQEMAGVQAAMPAKSDVKLVAKSYETLGSGTTILRYSGAGGWS